jgi:hypothetical protein
MAGQPYSSKSGKLGEPGSVYRLVPKKKGELEFVATVVLRELPAQVRLSLEAPSVSVSITDKFISLSDQVTLLVCEETFRFKGLSHEVFGFFAQPAIKAAHRRHMESFKRFAEIETAHARSRNPTACEGIAHPQQLT